MHYINVFKTGGIENKICSITVGNAKTNDTAMRVLRDFFNMRKALLVGGKVLCILGV
jgi:hypothetical protein